MADVSLQLVKVADRGTRVQHAVSLPRYVPWTRHPSNSLSLVRNGRQRHTVTGWAAGNENSFGDHFKYTQIRSTTKGRSRLRYWLLYFHLRLLWTVKCKEWRRRWDKRAPEKKDMRSCHSLIPTNNIFSANKAFWEFEAYQALKPFIALKKITLFLMDCFLSAFKLTVYLSGKMFLLFWWIASRVYLFNN